MDLDYRRGIEGRRTGVRWGKIIYPPLYVSQVALEVMLDTRDIRVSQTTLEVAVRPTDGNAFVSQSVLEVMVES